MNICSAPETILNDSPNPILVYDNNDTLQFVNPAFEMLTGFRENEVCGIKLPFPWWPKTDEFQLVSMFRDSFSKGGRQQAVKFLNKLGRCFYVDMVTSKANGNNQSISTWFDVTNEVESRLKLGLMLRQATVQLESLMI